MKEQRRGEGVTPQESGFVVFQPEQAAPQRNALHQPLPSAPTLVLHPCHILEFGPRLGGLVDVTLVQWALVPCLLAQCLMELELQHEAHKVPAGTDGFEKERGELDKGPLLRLYPVSCR